MAKTVNGAFNEFFNNIINIPTRDNENAIRSRNWLFEQIDDICNKGLFLKSAKGFNTTFGSFARKTKIKPLDDIDIIIGLNGGELNISGYNWDNMSLKLNNDIKDNQLIRLSDYTSIYSGERQLNSTKVKNKLISALKNIPQYENAIIRGSGSAVTLKLKSYSWTYDIIPAFYYGGGNGSSPYYLIPNGSGGWLKTNPKLEQERVSRLNQKYNGIVLKTIRLVKYWNKRGRMPGIESYVLETIVLDYFEKIYNSNPSKFVDIHFRDVLYYISNNIMHSVNDSKKIEGNINNLDWNEKNRIQQRAKADYQKASNAINFEVSENDMRKAINVWRSILGDNFPIYG